MMLVHGNLLQQRRSYKVKPPTRADGPGLTARAKTTTEMVTEGWNNGTSWSEDGETGPQTQLDSTDHHPEAQRHSQIAPHLVLAQLTNNPLRQHSTEHVVGRLAEAAHNLRPNKLVHGQMTPTGCSSTNQSRPWQRTPTHQLHKMINSEYTSSTATPVMIVNLPC